MFIFGFIWIVLVINIIVAMSLSNAFEGEKWWKVIFYCALAFILWPLFLAILLNERLA